MAKYENVKIGNHGHFSYVDGDRRFVKIGCPVSFSLVLIRMAWEVGCNFEDLANGFGTGLGTCGGVWSGIRDSNGPATDKMLERALNFIHDNLRQTAAR